MMAPLDRRAAPVTDTNRRKAAAILADVGQFVDVLDAARSLETNAWKPGVMGGGELGAQRRRAGYRFPADRRYRRGDLCSPRRRPRTLACARRRTLKFGMTPFSSVAMLENLALLKNRALQGPCFQQRLFAADLGDDIHPLPAHPPRGPLSPVH